MGGSWAKVLRRTALASLAFVVLASCAIAFGSFYPRFIVAISRPATPDEMQEIAIAVLRQTDSPFHAGESTVMYAAIGSHDLPAESLKAVAHRHVIAMPASLAHKPSSHSFGATVEIFLISPFGEATGMVYTSCGSLCGEGTRFVLRKHDGRWVVVSKSVELIA